MIFSGVTLANETRVWTSLTGHTFEGDLLELLGEDVRLENASGVSVSVKFTDLSVGDRYHVIRHVTAPDDILIKTWRTRSGHEVLAHLRDVNDAGVLLEWESGKRRLPLEVFEDGDQAVLSLWRQTRDEKLRIREGQIIAEMLKLPILSVQPGGRFETFKLPIPDDLHALLPEGYEDKREINAGLRVPETFDPRKVHPVFLPLVTGSGQGRHIQRGPHYARLLGDEDWVVIAAGWDDPADDRKNAPTYVAFMTLMRYLETYWPGFSRWPIATGGFSGGAKWAGAMAMMLNADGFTISGVYMGGCNEAFAVRYKEHLKTRTADCDHIAMFMSNGRSDNIANENHATSMMEDLRQARFRHLRLELYDGGHREHAPHFPLALAWFLEINPLPESSGEAAEKKPTPALFEDPSQKQWIRRLRSDSRF